MTGEVRAARQFFEHSARYDTGSYRCMRSMYRLAFYDQDFERAAQTALAIGRRYGSKDDFGDYLNIMRVVSQAPETDSLFLSLNLMDTDDVPWAPVITGLRMGAKSDDEIRDWLAINGKNTIRRSQARRFYVYSFLEDRKATPDLADQIENIEKLVELPEPERMPRKTMDQNRKPVLSIPALYAAVRYSVEQQQYEQAVTLLSQWTKVFRSPDESRSPFLDPYVTWSYLRTGDRATAERLMNVQKSRRGTNFEYWLSKAMLDAAEKRRGDALRALDLARYNVNTSTHDTRPISAWYQLVEACELLFEQTGDPAYGDKALELARLRQQVSPFTSWAYAVEAKYAKTAEERRRPLALALYLDPRSYHIANIPETEKAAARAWLEKNNPFRTSRPLPKIEASAPAPARVLMADGAHVN
jgi:hypothetical protein